MDRQIVVYIHTMEWLTDTQNNMNKCQKYYAEWKKPVKETVHTIWAQTCEVLIFAKLISNVTNEIHGCCGLGWEWGLIGQGHERTFWTDVNSVSQWGYGFHRCMHLRKLTKWYM